MSQQKIFIDPMTPHYQKDSLSYKSNISKDDLKHQKTSLIPRNNAPSNSPIYEDNLITQKVVNNSDKKTPTENHYKDIKEAEKNGIYQAIQETVRENRRNTFKFFGLLNKSEKIVYKLKNIIPIFTSEILIDTSKITVIIRPFFFSERIHSIAIKDITDVYVETAPFFGTLNIVDSGFTEKLISQKWFWKRDAEKARRIITGLVAASREGVDLKNIEDEALAEKLEEIGKLRATKTSVSIA